MRKREVLWRWRLRSIRRTMLLFDLPKLNTSMRIADTMRLRVDSMSEESKYSASRGLLSDLGRRVAITDWMNMNPSMTLTFTKKFITLE